MESNEIVKDEIFRIIEKQIRDNNPKKSKVTFKRHISLGYSKFESKKLIGQYVAIEIFNILKTKKP